MTGVLYQLGEFQFSLATGTPQVVDRRNPQRWSAVERIGRDVSFQWTGPSAREITLQGEIVPGLTGLQRSCQDLRDMADEGTPYVLVDGVGRNHGQWVILSVQERRDVLMDNGNARRIAFVLELRAYGIDDPGERANPLATVAAVGGLSDVLGFVDTIDLDFESALARDTTSWLTDTQFADNVGNYITTGGFDTSQLGAIRQPVSDVLQLDGAIGALGGSAFSQAQSDAWTGLGVNPVTMVSEWASGRGPGVTLIGIEALRSASSSALDAIGGASAPALGELRNAFGTLEGVLDMDPRITSAVRSLLEL